METKICTECGEEKPKDEFSLAVSKSSGKELRCSKCKGCKRKKKHARTLRNSYSFAMT